MESLATIDEFNDRIPGGIGQEDTARAQAMLADASALIRDEAGKTWTDSCRLWRFPTSSRRFACPRPSGRS